MSPGRSCSTLLHMAITEPTRHHQPLRSTLLDAVLGTFWIFVTAALAMSAALVVVAGPSVIEGTAPRYVLAVLLVLFSVHSWSEHRRREAIRHDARFQRARERRGF